MAACQRSAATQNLSWAIASVADLKETSGCDCQAEATVLAAPVGESPPMGTNVPLLWFLTVCDCSGDSFQPLSTALL